MCAGVTGRPSKSSPEELEWSTWEDTILVIKNDLKSPSVTGFVRKQQTNSNHSIELR